VVDTFERESHVADALRELGAVVRVEALRAGDYAVGNALVERKTVRDLHLSIIKGRFWPQVGRIRRAPRPYVLIEGGDIDDGPLRRDSVRGAWLALTELGVGVLRAESVSESAEWLYLLARREATRPRRRPAYTQRRQRSQPREAAEAMLAAAPGISVVSARILLARFGSVAAVLEAGPEEWLSVRGIGPKRASALAQTLNHPHRRR
jgi:Fanconi anemia group M protein